MCRPSDRKRALSHAVLCIYYIILYDYMYMLYTYKYVDTLMQCCVDKDHRVSPTAPSEHPFVWQILYERALNSLGGGVQNPHGMSPSLNLTRHYPACVFTHFGGDPDVTFDPLFGPDLDSLGHPAAFLGHQLHAAFKTFCTQANVQEFIHPEKAPRARRPR